MTPMAFVLLLLLTLVAFGMTVGVVIFFLQRYLSPEPGVIQQRLTNLKNGSKPKSFESGDSSKPKQRISRHSNYKYEQLNQYLSKLAFYQTLKLRLQQAELLEPADMVMLKFFFCPVIISVLLLLITGLFPVLLLGGMVPLAYNTYVNSRRNKRFQKFVALLPDTLNMLTSALRAGHSFQSSLSVVASEMPDPISAEFSSVVSDVSLGMPLKESLNRLVYRMDALPDVKMLSTAINIQREAGGNLAEILENLGDTIRERFKLKGQIASLTGQSRLTGYVLGAAPCVLLLFLSIFLFSYVEPLYKTEWGNMALMAALVMQVIGFVIIKKIVDIRV
jgi:tight adherence protein B